MRRRTNFPILAAMLLVAASSHDVFGDPLRLVPGADAAGLFERVSLVVDALQLEDSQQALLLSHQIEQAQADAGNRYRAVQRILDPACLLEVGINPESRVKVAPGPAPLQLQNEVWRYYLVKVVNEAGVTAPLRFSTEQAFSNERTDRDSWLEIETFRGDVIPHTLSGDKLEYRIVRLRAHAIGKRSALIAADVGQGTADIGFRNDTMLTFDCTADQPVSVRNVRRPQSDADLEYWLRNMIQDHGFTIREVRQTTGLTKRQIQEAIQRLNLQSNHESPRSGPQRLKLLPFPGGRHPRLGFRRAAIDPQRETKASVFTPWDSESYVVLDVPEAIWSNLGLTYLAHTDVPTLWDKQGIAMRPLEWDRSKANQLSCNRTLPNGIQFGVRMIADSNAIKIEMWLRNATDEELTGMRVQNCALLAAAKGFESQTNDNKVFWGSYAACSDASGERWVIMGGDPVHRVWGNAECPCLHADPQFPDCPPGETVHARAWLSFYEGSDIHDEMLRIDRTGWRKNEPEDQRAAITGAVFDAETGQPLPARLHVRDDQGRWLLAESLGGVAVHYQRDLPHLPHSPEVHTSLSADPFELSLPRGEYELRVEHGKDYLPQVQRLRVKDSPIHCEFAMQRWINMADRGWYSGDVHVHRSLDELPTAMLAEDLNVALPLSYWVTDSRDAPGTSSQKHAGSGLMHVDATHAIQPTNTEYEITSINGRRRLLGACLILNHEAPLHLTAPPLAPIGRAAHEQGALVDIEKHTWPWSLVVASVMGADLFELANNHIWQTEFGFGDFAVDTVGNYMQLQYDDGGLTEWGWIKYGLETYYALLNCGLDLRVSAGTASGVHPVPIGFGRVYVHLPGGFNFDEWMRGLGEGRSFVSTGPMLLVKFDGDDPGAKLTRSANEKTGLHVTGEALSPRPLERIEVVRNGLIVHTLEPANRPRREGGYGSTIDVQVECNSTSWVAVRCFEDRDDARVRFAHTNPVHVQVAGRPLLPRAEQIDYLVRRVREELTANELVLDAASIREFRAALAFYEGLRDRVLALRSAQAKAATAKGK